MDIDGIQVIVVGGGISGLTVARRLMDRGIKPLIVEKENELGGMCAAYWDRDTGIEVHRYGTHVLHTSDTKVQQFLERFCKLNHYRHRVFAKHNGQVYSFPINLHTINQFYGKVFNPQELAVHRCHLPIVQGNSFEAVARSEVGDALYYAFLHGYTLKQWGRDPDTLPSSMFWRIAPRHSYNSDYFLDPWQGVPLDGYNHLFDRLAQGIPRVLGVDFTEARASIPVSMKVVYTGALDAYFNYGYGHLPWRALRFDLNVAGCPDYQGCATMNYVDATPPYTRIHEFKHLHPERANTAQTTLTLCEYPMEGAGAGSYPVEPDGKMAQRYRVLAEQTPNTYFVGRLGTYRYLNMDQAVAQALIVAEEL